MNCHLAPARGTALRNDSIEAAIRDWDGESVVASYDAPTGAWIFIAIHSTRRGPAGGGTRLKPYDTPADAVRDALRLASAMTRKFAVPGLPYGGGKAVISVPADLDVLLRPGLLRRYGALVKNLGGLYLTGPDVGTNGADMGTIAETGAPYVFGAASADGAGGGSGAITAAGVFAALEVVCERLFAGGALRGRTLLVQGAGNVGGPLIQRLRNTGAKVLFTDLDRAAAHKVFEGPDVVRVPAEAVYDTACDILVPCALGGVLNENTIARLRCRAVAGAANNQLATPEDARRLQERGILYAPDYVVSVGGAMGLLGMELEGWSAEQAEQEVKRSVQRTLREVFSLASATGSTPADAAEELARRNLASVRTEAPVRDRTVWPRARGHR
jgi:leucine dehydrogenase